MLPGNCGYVALKGVKLSLDLWTAVAWAERPDVPVHLSDSPPLLCFHSDWQGTACRAALEKPGIMTGWSEPRRRRWKNKPKKKEGEGRRKKKGVGALSHIHKHTHTPLLIASSPRQLVFTRSQTFHFFFFLRRTSASCIISVGGRGERIGWKQTNENASLHHSPSVSSIFLVFGVKIWKTAQTRHTCWRPPAFFMLIWC